MLYDFAEKVIGGVGFIFVALCFVLVALLFLSVLAVVGGSLKANYDAWYDRYERWRYPDWSYSYVEIPGETYPNGWYLFPNPHGGPELWEKRPLPRPTAKERPPGTVARVEPPLSVLELEWKRREHEEWEHRWRLDNDPPQYIPPQLVDLRSPARHAASFTRNSDWKILQDENELRIRHQQPFTPITWRELQCLVDPSLEPFEPALPLSHAKKAHGYHAGGAALPRVSESGLGVNIAGGPLQPHFNPSTFMNNRSAPAFEILSAGVPAATGDEVNPVLASDAGHTPYPHRHAACPGNGQGNAISNLNIASNTIPLSGGVQESDIPQPASNFPPAAGPNPLPLFSLDQAATEISSWLQLGSFNNFGGASVNDISKHLSNDELKDCITRVRDRCVWMLEFWNTTPGFRQCNPQALKSQLGFRAKNWNDAGTYLNRGFNNDEANCKGTIIDLARQAYNALDDELEKVGVPF